MDSTRAASEVDATNQRPLSKITNPRVKTKVSKASMLLTRDEYYSEVRLLDADPRIHLI